MDTGKMGLTSLFELWWIKLTILNKHPEDQREWTASLTHHVSHLVLGSLPQKNVSDLMKHSRHHPEECYLSNDMISAILEILAFKLLYESLYVALRPDFIPWKSVQWLYLAQARGHGKAKGNCFLGNWPFGQEISRGKWPLAKKTRDGGRGGGMPTQSPMPQFDICHFQLLGSFVA